MTTATTTYKKNKHCQISFRMILDAEGLGCIILQQAFGMVLSEGQ